MAAQRKPGHGEQARQQPEPALPDEWLSDDQWLAWARDYGLDLRDRDQLLDTAAVGLTVLCWRNTALEDVHAGGERTQALEQLGRDADDPAVQAEEEQACHAFDEALDADWDELAEVDPDETSRIEVLLDGRGQGFGIPDDIMMRLNVSTAVDLRELLAEVLPEAITEPGEEIAYDHESAPGHVVELVDLLQDPDRLLTVGGTSITAGDVLGDTWDEYTEDVMRKISMHLRFCDLLGVRRALWYASMSGILYASDWFPNPWWTRAVELLRNAYHNRTARSSTYQNEWPRSHSPAKASGSRCWLTRPNLTVPSVPGYSGPGCMTSSTRSARVIAIVSARSTTTSASPAWQ